MAQSDIGMAPRLCWLGLAGLAVLAAAMLSPEFLIGHLTGQAQRFRDELADGICLVRLGLLGVALLALASLAWRCDTPKAMRPNASRSLDRTDWLVGLCLFLLMTVLSLSNLNGSFWWDELTSLSLVVKRGPAVILAYSCKANNHVLNSLGMWLCWQAFGDNEVAMRLPSLLLGTAIAPSVYLCLATRWGRATALLAGVLITFHLGIQSHTVEARGYAGAVLCSFLACVCFASLLQVDKSTQEATRSSVIPTGPSTPHSEESAHIESELPFCASRLAIFSYIALSLAAIGFVTTTLLVPLAHGVIGLVLALRGSAADRAVGRNAVFACLWVGVLAVVLFGLPLPQTWHYARTEAARDHLPLGLKLLETSAQYLAGTSILPAALLTLGLSAWGWTQVRVGSHQAFAFLGPLAAVLGWMLLPGALLSARFLCFLVPTIVLGVALALSTLAQGKVLARTTLVGLLIVWLTASAPSLLRWQALGNPNLRELARRLDGKAVALLGSQADMNRHYFPEAPLIHETGDLRAMPTVQYVVQGKVDNTKVDEAIILLGFSCVKRLVSALPGRTEYVIYRHDENEAQSHRR